MMSRNGIFVILGACILAGLLIAGCTQPQAPATVQNTIVPAQVSPSSETAIPASTATAGMANPASVNCGEINGTTEIKTAADGSQYGMCTFSNGTSCEEWALFRGEGCKAGISATNNTASK